MQTNVNNTIQESAEQFQKEFGNNALKALDLMLKYIPMYQGNLNPTWEYWNDVKQYIKEAFVKEKYVKITHGNSLILPFSEV